MMMKQKKELSYFHIDGAFGGSQSWMHDPLLFFGGCAALTACDICIALTVSKGYQTLYPFTIHSLNKQDYRRFAGKMKPYLHPRLKGINTPELFIDGFGAYLRNSGEKELHLSSFSGDLPQEEAETVICRQIDHGNPLPFLLLKHADQRMKEYEWHWFLLVGYRVARDGLFVKTATYGKSEWLLFSDLWNTGFSQKGGMILIHEGQG